MNPNEINNVKKFLEIAKSIGASATIDREEVIAILDCINQLEKSREYYKQSRDRYTDNIMFIAKQCDELQADNERLKGEIVVHKKIVDERAAAIFQYEKVVQDLHRQKSETLKEVWKELREMCDAPHWCVWLSEIDCFFEKIVGDYNAVFTEN